VDQDFETYPIVAFSRRTTTLPDAPYHVWWMDKALGEWSDLQYEGFSSTSQADVAHYFGNYRWINQRWLSKDFGEWEDKPPVSTGFTGGYFGLVPVIYNGNLWFVTRGPSGSSERVIIYNRRRVAVRANVVVNSVDPWWVFTIEQNGMVHARALISGIHYYSRSSDLGETWSEPVECFPSTPLLWTGGTYHQTSARNLVTSAMYARGDNVAFVGLENWTEHYHCVGENVPFRSYYPGPITYVDYYIRYTPMDMFFRSSNDGGQTWGSVQRVKLDEFQNGYTWHNYFYGAESPYGIGTGPAIYADEQLRLTSYGGDLYVFLKLRKFWKRFGEEAPMPLIGYGWTRPYPLPAHNMAVFRASGWGSSVAKVGDIYDQTGAQMDTAGRDPGQYYPDPSDFFRGIAVWSHDAQASYDDEHALYAATLYRSQPTGSQSSFRLLWENGQIRNTIVWSSTGLGSSDFCPAEGKPHIRFWVPYKEEKKGRSFWW
jgi:hypothetical protein